MVVSVHTYLFLIYALSLLTFGEKLSKPRATMREIEGDKEKEDETMPAASHQGLEGATSLGVSMQELLQEG